MISGSVYATVSSIRYPTCLRINVIYDLDSLAYKSVDNVVENFRKKYCNKKSDKNNAKNIILEVENKIYHPKNDTQTKGSVEICYRNIVDKDDVKNTYAGGGLYYSNRRIYGVIKCR